MTQLMRSPSSVSRYLRYDEKTSVVTGMNHQLANLECLMREAYTTGRLAVLPALKLLPSHNFGVSHEWRWESYVDLGESQLVDIAGTERPLPLVTRLPDAAMRTLTLEPGACMPSSSANYDLVVRRIERSLYRKDVPAKDGPPIRFRLRPAPRVLELARPVLADLTARGDGRFVAVHARRKDRGLKSFTEPARIRAHLEAKGVADGAVVFLLSDERTPDFWAPLKAHYELVRHTDYPPLAALVSRADGRCPDNYLLYEVEKEIMRSAAMRIETFPNRGRTDAHSALVPQWIFSAVRLARQARRRVWVVVRWVRRPWREPSRTD